MSNTGTVTLHVENGGLQVARVFNYLNGVPHVNIVSLSNPVAGFTTSATITLESGQSFGAACAGAGGPGISTPSSFQCIPGGNVDVFFYTAPAPPPSPTPPPSPLTGGTVTVHIVDAGVNYAAVARFIAPGPVLDSPIINVTNPPQGAVYSSSVGTGQTYFANGGGLTTPGVFVATSGNVDVYVYASATSPNIPLPTPTPTPQPAPLPPPPAPPPPPPTLPTNNPAGIIPNHEIIYGSGAVNMHIMDSGIATAEVISFLDGVPHSVITVLHSPPPGVYSSDVIFLTSDSSYGATCATVAPGNPPGFCYPAFFNCIPGQNIDVYYFSSPFGGTVTGHIEDGGVTTGLVAAEGASVATLLLKAPLASGVAGVTIEGSPYYAETFNFDGTMGVAFPALFTCTPNGNVDVFFYSKDPVLPSGVAPPWLSQIILEQLTGDQFSAIKSDGTTQFIGPASVGPIGEPAWPKFCGFSQEAGAPPAYQSATPGASSFSYSTTTPTSPTGLVQLIAEPYVSGSYMLRYTAEFQAGALASGVYTRFFTTFPYTNTIEWGLDIWFQTGITSDPTDAPYIEVQYQWGRMFY